MANIIRKNFTIEKDVFLRFQQACGVIPMSRVLNEFMSKWASGDIPGIVQPQHIMPSAAQHEIELPPSDVADVPPVRTEEPKKARRRRSA